MHFDEQIDTRGTKCTMPVLKSKKALANMQAGDVLLVLATDPASVADLAQFAAQTGHKILAQEKVGEEWQHYIEHK